MICPKCDEDKKPSEFYKKTSSRKQPYCKPCFNSYCSSRWIQKKKDAIEYLGGKCLDCKGIFPYFVYDFHHVNGKDYSWTKLRLKSWSTITKELDRCVLLCSNCHRTRHYG